MATHGKVMTLDGAAFGVPGLTLVTEDLSPAAWVAEGLAPIGRDRIVLQTVAPPGFPRYGRLLHPFYRESHSDLTKVRWREVAEWSGRHIHPEVQWEALVRPRPGFGAPPRPWDDEPSQSMNRTDLVSLIDSLLPYTRAAAQCYFAIWEGYGNLPFVPTWPGLETPNRRYLLFAGPLSLLRDHGTRGTWSRVPDLWWPADRHWYVGSDTDLFSTYVGGSAECIETLLDNPTLETLPTRLDHRVDIDGDEVNWQPPRQRR